MKKETKLAVASVFAAVSMSAFAPAWVPAVHAQSTAAPAEAAKVGAAAPDFELKDSHDKTYKLSDFKGRFVVLEWINFNCPFVKKHYNSGNMQALQQKYEKKGVEWLSICSSAPGKSGNFPNAEINKQLKEHHSHAKAYLIDADGTVGKLYGAKATPTMAVINPKGDLVYIGAIDDKNTADEADIKTAKNYLAAALDEALNGKPVAIAQTTAYGCSVKYAK